MKQVSNTTSSAHSPYYYHVPPMHCCVDCVSFPLLSPLIILRQEKKTRKRGTDVFRGPLPFPIPLSYIYGRSDRESLFRGVTHAYDTGRYIPGLRSRGSFHLYDISSPTGLGSVCPSIGIGLRTRAPMLQMKSRCLRDK